MAVTNGTRLDFHSLYSNHHTTITLSKADALSLAINQVHTCTLGQEK